MDDVTYIDFVKKIFSGNLLIVFLKVILFSYREISLDKKRIRKKTDIYVEKGR